MGLRAAIPEANLLRILSWRIPTQETTTPQRGPTVRCQWIRDTHLYAGLMAGPFVVVFAVGAILFNHTWMPWGAAARVPVVVRTASFAPPAENAGSVLLAKAMLREVGVAGEIDAVRRQPNPARLEIRVERPGRSLTVRADLTTGVAAIEDKGTGVWEALLYLHTRPGMPNAAMRGNWFHMKLWGWLGRRHGLSDAVSDAQWHLRVARGRLTPSDRHADRKSQPDVPGVESETALLHNLAAL